MVFNENQKHLIETFTKEESEHNNKIYAFRKQVMLISTGLLGGLISLHKDTDLCLARFFFKLTISLIGLGILFLSICLYEEVNLSKLVLQERSKQVIQSLSDNPKLEQVTGVTVSWFFVLARVLAYLFLIVGLSCLIIYGALTA